MTDRLAEIKARYEPTGNTVCDDITWLVAEIERLRLALDTNVALLATAWAELVAVRTALAGIYDATSNWMGNSYEVNAARAIASDVLGARGVEGNTPT